MKHIHSIIRQLGEEDETILYEIAAHEEKRLFFVIDAKKDVHIDIRVALNGTHSVAAIFAIVIPHEGAKVTLDTHQVHMVTDTKSTLLVKSILRDHTDFRFHGNIHIAKDARHADAYQKNMNLLVGLDMHVETQPVLEIFHHDVSCSHGVWTSPIPVEPLWYMESRGVSPTEAKKLYIHGFLDDIMSQITSKKIHAMIDTHLRNL